MAPHLSEAVTKEGVQREQDRQVKSIFTTADVDFLAVARRVSAYGCGSAWQTRNRGETRNCSYLSKHSLDRPRSIKNSFLFEPLILKPAFAHLVIQSNPPTEKQAQE
jgi:hypothetical protein